MNLREFWRLLDITCWCWVNKSYRLVYWDHWILRRYTDHWNDIRVTNSMNATPATIINTPYDGETPATPFSGIMIYFPSPVFGVGEGLIAFFPRMPQQDISKNCLFLEQTLSFPHLHWRRNRAAVCLYRILAALLHLLVHVYGVMDIV